jgi:four helix bundle protein
VLNQEEGIKNKDGAVHNFRELHIWQQAMDLAELVYRLCARLPGDERYGLIAQLKRAAVSIPSNIAEGAGRNSNNEFKHFLAIALGSLFEVETQLLLARRLDLIRQDEVDLIAVKIVDLQKKIVALQKKLH